MFGVEYYIVFALSMLLCVEIFKCSYEIRRDIYQNELERPNVNHINIYVHTDGETSEAEVFRVVEGAARTMREVGEGNVIHGVEIIANQEEMF